jgi:hypothetical protein
VGVAIALSQCAVSGFFLIVSHCPVETFIKAGVRAGTKDAIMAQNNGIER